MKVMIDTNVIISTVLFPKGLAARAFQKSLYWPYEPVVCDYIVYELRKKFNEKFSDRILALESFMDLAFPYIKIIATPNFEILEEFKIRDIKDRAIYRAAVEGGADCLLTGDKDFLEALDLGLKIISPREFLELY